MRKNYNYTRRKLYLPEYGRHIHEMIDSLLLIEDRAERTRQAKAVIAVMGNLNPLLRDTADLNTSSGIISSLCRISNSMSTRHTHNLHAKSWS